MNPVWKLWNETAHYIFLPALLGPADRASHGERKIKAMSYSSWSLGRDGKYIIVNVGRAMSQLIKLAH